MAGKEVKKILPSGFSSVIGFVKSGKYTFLAGLTEKVFFYVILIYLARLLSLEEYGKISVIFAASNILVYVFELGLGNYLQRETACGSDDVSDKLRFSIFIRIILFPIYLTAAYIYISGDLTNNCITALLILGSAYLFNFNSLLVKVYYGLNRFKESFKIHLTSRTIFFFSVFIMVILGLNENLILANLFAAGVFQTVGLLNKMRQYALKLIPRFYGFKFAGEVFSQSLPMGLGVLCVWLYDKLDIILIKELISVKAVSLYSVPYSLYKIGQMFSGIILIPLYSFLSKEYSFTKKLDRAEIYRTAFILIIISLCAVIAVYLFGDFIIITVLGQKYSESVDVLKWIIWALPALFLNNLTGTVLNSIREEKKAMLSALFALVLNISLNLTLLPIIGFYGAVYSTIATEMSIFALQLYFIVKSGKITNVQ